MKRATLLMHHDKIEAIHTKCFCKHCATNLTPYILINMTQFFRFITDFSTLLLLKKQDLGPVGIPGHVWSLFERSVDAMMRHEEADEVEGKRTSVVARVMSLTGSGISIASLGIVSFHQVFMEAADSRAKRCQLGISASKILFTIFPFMRRNFHGMNQWGMCENHWDLARNIYEII